MRKVVTVKWPNLGRLLLFIYLENQRNDADDQDTELKQVGISDHDITPLLCSGGGTKKCGLLPKEGPPPTVTGSAGAYPCARDIKAYYAECGNHSILKLEDGSCDLNHRDRPPDFGEDHSSQNSQLKNSRLPWRPNTARYWPGASFAR